MLLTHVLWIMASFPCSNLNSSIPSSDRPSVTQVWAVSSLLLQCILQHTIVIELIRTWNDQFNCFCVCFFFVSDSPHSTPWGQWHFTKAPLHLRARPIAPSGCFRVFVGSFTALSPVSYLLNEGVRTGDCQTCPPQTVLILIVSLVLWWSPLTSLTFCEWAVFFQGFRPLLPLFSPQCPSPFCACQIP